MRRDVAVAIFYDMAMGRSDRAAMITMSGRALSDDSARLIGVQLLDRGGAGIFTALTPLGDRRPDARHRPTPPKPK
ncbi:hypothetical protein CHT98_11150 (plasmid) [Azospirillum brasilense]|uniref:Uncharacterized protein n=1 Tax=Azospirillum brasilense TaxID=192 RepID=A0A235HEJ0_AZOBR|nr:hypothetical protein CHT98_11150 [Azospirillum brasilense]